MLLCNIHFSRAAEEDSAEIELPDLEILGFLGQVATNEGDSMEPGSLLSDEFRQFLKAAIDSRSTVNAIAIDKDAGSEEDNL